MYRSKYNINRLAEDHNRAKEIGNVLKKANYVESIRPIETNIVLFDLKEGVKNFNNRLLDKGIKASFMGDKTVRFVTNLGFCDNQLAVLLKVLSQLN